MSKKQRKEIKHLIKTETFETHTKTKKKHFSADFLSNTRWQYVLIFIISFILYGNTLTLEYALDDRLMITDNAFTKKGASGIKDILTNDSFVGFFGEKKNLLSGGRYRPLSQVMFAIEYELFGLSPFIGHLINILLYALSCIVLLKVLKLMFKNQKGAFEYLPYLITLFFISHPLHTEIVANIKGRDDIMSFLGAISVIFFSIKYFEKKDIKYLLLSFIVFFLTLMSKENSITFLGIVPLTLFFFIKPRFTDYIICMLPLILSAAIFIAIRYAVLGYELNIGIEKELLNNPYVNATSAEKYATIFYTMGIYLKLLIFPHPLTHDYYPFHIEIINWASPKALLSLIAYLLLGTYAFWGTLKRQIPAYGIAFYLITFSIATNLVFNIGTFMNERFMYVPLLGFCILLSYSIIYIASNKINKEFRTQFIFLSCIAIFLLYAPKTISRNFVWKNDFTLFTTDVKVSVNSAKCNVSAGGVLLEASQKLTDEKEKQEYYQKAAKYLKRGIEIHPYYVAGWVLYGNALLYLERFHESLICYENALKLAPSNSDAINNISHLALISQNKGLYDFSIYSLNLLSEYVPLSTDNQFNMARAYEGKSSLDTAIKILNGIIEDAPRHQAANSKLGELYGKAFNNLEKSIYHLMIAYEENPKDASNLENLGIAYGLKKDFNNSLLYFEEAMALNPEKPELYMNISQTYAIMGNIDKAQTYRSKAEELFRKQ